MEPVRQLRLLPAGCQPWQDQVCCGTRQWLAYAATQTVYVYSLSAPEPFMRRTWRLAAILHDQRKTVVGIGWTRSGPHLVCAFSDSSLCVWNVATRAVLARVALATHVRYLECCQHDGRDAVALCGIQGPVHLWHYGSNDDQHSLSLFREDLSTPFSSDVSCLKCHPKLDRIAVGHKNGKISILNSNPERSRQQVSLQDVVNDGGPYKVTALSWDPLSDIYLLGCVDNNYIFLIDSDNLSVLFKYEEVSSFYNCQCFLEWLPNSPGMFLFTNNKNGILKLFTVSKETPTECLSICDSSLHCMKVITNFCESGARSEQATKLVCALSNGGVGVYCVSNRQWDWLQPPGHRETIFDVKFNHEDHDLLASCSYDGFVKVWNVNSMVSSREFQLDCTVYALSWAPADLQSLAAATSSNGVAIIRLDRGGRVIRHFSEHGDHPVYNVAWCLQDSRRLASVGGDARCIVRQLDGTLLKVYEHPASVFGCDWRDDAVLATACSDSVVRVFNVNSPGQQPLCVLNSHEERAFQVRWHPLVPNLLASGSDDGSIIVWDYRNCRQERRLMGHSGKVRALLWNPELANILLSGSWDYTVRVWNVGSGKCLYVVSEHVSDVYGLSIHPARPFFVASSSRDSTIRFWDISSLFYPLLNLIVVSDDWHSVGSSIDSDSIDGLDKASVLLNGVQGLRLSSCWTDTKARLMCLIRLLSSDPSGTNLCDLLAVSLGETDVSKLSKNYLRFIVHSKHAKQSLLHAAKRTSVIPESTLQRTSVAFKRQKHEEACLYLRAGNFRRFCEIETEIGSWDLALAVAPSVSLHYWRQLMERRASSLTQANDPSAEIYLTAGGQGGKVTELLCKLGDPLTAINTHFINLSLNVGCVSSKMSDSIDEPSEKTSNTAADHSFGDALPRIRQVARIFLANHKPISSACVYLASGYMSDSLSCLMQGHCCELTVLIWRLGLTGFEHDQAVTDAISCLVDRCCEQLQWTSAVKLAQMLPDSQVKCDLLNRVCVLSQKDAAHCTEVYTLCGYSSIDACLARGQSESNSCLKAQFFLLGKSYAEGICLALSLFDVARLADCGVERWSELVGLLNLCCDAVGLMNPAGGASSRVEQSLLIVCGCVGAYQAEKRGDPVAAVALLRQTRRLLQQDSESAPSAAAGHSALPRLELVDGELARLRAVSLERDCAVSLQGGDIPRHSAGPLHCCLSDSLLAGPVLLLDQVGPVSAQLAVMWSRVCRLAPLGLTGPAHARRFFT